MENNPETKETIFDKVHSEIVANKTKKEAGGITSISIPFPRLSLKFPGWVKHSYTIITASSGIKINFNQNLHILIIFRIFTV